MCFACNSDAPSSDGRGARTRSAMHEGARDRRRILRLHPRSDRRRAERDRAPPGARVPLPVDVGPTTRQSSGRTALWARAGIVGSRERRRCRPHPRCSVHFAREGAGLNRPRRSCASAPMRPDLELRTMYDIGTRFGTYSPATRSLERDRRLFAAPSNGAYGDRTRGLRLANTRFRGEVRSD